MDVLPNAQIKRIVKIISVAIFCNAMCFFGFVYEEIVDIPNILGSPITAKQQWTEFHRITNPAHYHVIPALVAIISIVALYTFRKEFSPIQKKNLRLVIITTLMINVLTGIAVTQLNNTLFFGSAIYNTDVVITLASYWAVLNFIRLAIVFICIVALINLYNTFIRRINPIT